MCTGHHQPPTHLPLPSPTRLAEDQIRRHLSPSSAPPPAAPGRTRAPPPVAPGFPTQQALDAATARLLQQLNNASLASPPVFETPAAQVRSGVPAAPPPLGHGLRMPQTAPQARRGRPVSNPAAAAGFPGNMPPPPRFGATPAGAAAGAANMPLPPRSAAGTPAAAGPAAGGYPQESRAQETTWAQYLQDLMAGGDLSTPAPQFPVANPSLEDLLRSSGGGYKLGGQQHLQQQQRRRLQARQQQQQQQQPSGGPAAAPPAGGAAGSFQPFHTAARPAAAPAMGAAPFWGGPPAPTRNHFGGGLLGSAAAPPGGAMPPPAHNLGSGINFDRSLFGGAAAPPTMRPPHNPLRSGINIDRLSV
jgi:hypothetical protein